MSQSTPKPGTRAPLRRRAEKLLHEGIKPDIVPETLDSVEINELIHDLQVHQIELEMQNDELCSAQQNLEHARDRYYSLFDFAPVGYITLNQDDRIKEANITIAQMLAIDRVALIDRPITSYIASQSQNDYFRLKRLLIKQKKSQSHEIFMKNTSGKDIPVQLSGYELSLENLDQEGGREIRLAVIDIRERKLLEERRNMFFSIASHELRTPLTNIKLSLDLFKNSETENLTESQHTFLKTASKGVERLQRLINEITDLQRFENIALDYQTNPTDLASVLTEAVEDCKSMAAFHNVKLELINLSNTVNVDIDSGRLIQVLFNLIANAVRFSPPEGKVTLSISNFSNKVRVSVTDNGPGVPDEFVEHLFEPFAQAEPSIENNTGLQHLGLGLSIAKRIIENMGGKIGYEFEPDISTTFYVELPVMWSI